MENGLSLISGQVNELLADHRVRSAELAVGEDERSAAEQFERLFATMLVKEMRKALPEGFFGKGAGADIYQGWLDEHLGAALTQGSGLGLHDAILADFGVSDAAPESNEQHDRGDA